MDRLVEQPFASALGTLAVSWVLLDVRDEACIEDRLAIMPRIESTIQIGVLCTNPRTGALGRSPTPVTMSAILHTADVSEVMRPYENQLLRHGKSYVKLAVSESVPCTTFLLRENYTSILK